MTFNSKNPTVKLTEHSMPKGAAYYISGEEELVYSLDIPDTAEYLAIENHLPFWCRPFQTMTSSVCIPSCRQVTGTPISAEPICLWASVIANQYKRERTNEKRKIFTKSPYTHDLLRRS